MILKTGTVVDATLIAAPSSTKNKDGERDPEMHQAKKGNQWHFGMKAHIGVNDVTQGHGLLHGHESVVFADAGYQGADKRPGKRRALADGGWGALLEQAEKLKASVRAKVEHPFRVIKRQFSHVKVRYRGLAKNTAQLVTLFALSNLWMVRKRVLKDLQARVRLQRGQEPECGLELVRKRANQREIRLRFHHLNTCASRTVSTAFVQTIPKQLPN